MPLSQSNWVTMSRMWNDTCGAGTGAAEDRKSYPVQPIGPFRCVCFSWLSCPVARAVAKAVDQDGPEVPLGLGRIDMPDGLLGVANCRTYQVSRRATPSTEQLIASLGRPSLSQMRK